MLQQLVKHCVAVAVLDALRERLQAEGEHAALGVRILSLHVVGGAHNVFVVLMPLFAGEVVGVELVAEPFAHVGEVNCVVTLARSAHAAHGHAQAILCLAHTLGALKCIVRPLGAREADGKRAVQREQAHPRRTE